MIMIIMIIMINMKNRVKTLKVKTLYPLFYELSIFYLAVWSEVAENFADQLGR